MGVTGVLFKGSAYRLGLTSSEFQHWDTSDIIGGTEVSGIEARAGGSAFYQTEMLTIVSFLSPFSTEPAGRPISEYQSTWLTLFTLP